MSELILAAIQAAPVHFDREASTEKACRLVIAAAEKGVIFAAFKGGAGVKGTRIGVTYESVAAMRNAGLYVGVNYALEDRRGLARDFVRLATQDFRHLDRVLRNRS